MVNYLFIDNFRGFANTYIPILDVNFLVGQNSTGKTSVMGLLKLLSTPHILWGHDFGDTDINFGHFKDMVSAHSVDRTYFRVGAILRGQSRGGPRIQAMLFTYKEVDGLPRLANFTTTIENKQVSLRFNGRQVQYKLSDIHNKQTIDGLRNEVIPRWVKEQSSGASSGYRQLPASKVYLNPDRSNLYAALVMALEHSPSKGRLVFSLGYPMGPELIWIAPIRTKPKRTYDEFQTEFSPEGAHTPYLIRRTLQSKTDAQTFHRFMKRIGKASGLFHSINIKKFGRRVTAPFEVDAVVDGKALNLSTVGYGVSQSLPVFVELLTSPRGSCFAIQQPEVHLHPRAQAALGDVFFEMARSDKKRFLIETHSDFTVDRFRINYRWSETTTRSQVLFFERRDKHNTVTPILIEADGELKNPPQSYRSFFIKEEMELLGL
jgi:hypothetical protein